MQPQQDQQQTPQIPVDIRPKYTELDGIIMSSAEVWAKDVKGKEFQVGVVPPTSTGKTVAEWVAEKKAVRAKLEEDAAANLAAQLQSLDDSIAQFESVEEPVVEEPK